MKTKITYNLVATKNHREGGYTQYKKGGLVVKGLTETRARKLMEIGVRYVIAMCCYGNMPPEKMEVVQVTTITKQTTKKIKFN